MPSPFPGMDPYLEAPDIWPDFHDALAYELRTTLNSLLPAPYYARLQMRPEVGIADEAGRRIVPDVAVADRPGQGSGGGQTTVRAGMRSSVSQSITVTVLSEPLHHAVVEIRDPRNVHQVVTLIEIVSPSNKRPGGERRLYLQKQREVFDSGATFIEVDLLRSGERLFSNLYVRETVSEMQPPPDYLVLVNRGWERVNDSMNCQLFPFQLKDVLPCIPVPLRPQQPEIVLDLQFVFNRVYDDGPYRRGAVDYTRPPEPPLTEDAATWAEQRIKDWLAAPPPP